MNYKVAFSLETVSIFTYAFNSLILWRHAWILDLPTSFSPKKNPPERSYHLTLESSHMVNFRHPLMTIFLTTSRDIGPSPKTRISAFDCLLTASTPIAPI